jgi:peptidoglycan/LPS O-acetylase OafA/YrhL
MTVFSNSHPEGESGDATGAAAAGSEPARPPIRHLGQVKGFDGLRGVAVIIVVVSHMSVFLPIPHLLVVPGGVVSLDSFFVLSGFLITCLLLKEQNAKGRVDRFAFYRRRALRLLPALLLLLVAHAIYAYFVGLPEGLERTSLLSIAFYVSNWQLASHTNYFGGTIAEGLNHMWSLSFEEQFYLVWPWVVIFFLGIRTKLRTVVIVMLTIIFAITVHRWMMYHGPNSWYAPFVRTDTRADSILWGALVAHLWVRGKEPRRYLRLATWVAAAWLLFCLAYAQIEPPFLYRGGLVSIDVACCVILLAILDGNWAGNRLFELKPFILLGTISYGLYLFHLPVFFGVRRYGSHLNNVERVIVAVGLTFAITLASWFLLERPALAWKSRLERKRVATIDRADPSDSTSPAVPPAAPAPSAAPSAPAAAPTAPTAPTAAPSAPVSPVTTGPEPGASDRDPPSAEPPPVSPAPEPAAPASPFDESWTRQGPGKPKPS